MATQSFEDRIKAIVKERLNPDTEDLMRRKSTADAEYYGPENLDFDQFRDVSDPFARRRLVDMKNQGAMATSNALGGALNNREVGITSMVDAFSKARAEEAAMEAEQNRRDMAEREFALKQQELAANNAYRNASLANERSRTEKGLDPTDLQREYEFIKATQGEEAAQRWLALNANIPAAPAADVPASGGGGIFSSLLGGGVGAMAGRAGGAMLGARLGATAGAVGGPIGMGIGGLAGAAALPLYNMWRARNQ